MSRVAAKPALYEAAGGKAMRDASVEADARDVEEQSSVELTGHRSGVRRAATSMALTGSNGMRNSLARPLPIRWELFPAWQEHQRRTDFVDGPVRPTRRRATRPAERSGGQLAAVARPFCHEYLALVATTSDQRRRELGAIARAAGHRCGDWIDDDRYTRRCQGVRSPLTELRLPTRPRSSFGCTNHVSAPGRREVRLSTSCGICRLS